MVEDHGHTGPGAEEPAGAAEGEPAGALGVANPSPPDPGAEPESGPEGAPEAPAADDAPDDDPPPTADEAPSDDDSEPLGPGEQVATTDLSCVHATCPSALIPKGTRYFNTRRGPMHVACSHRTTPV